MSAIIYTWTLSTWCVASTTEETFSMNLILINYFFTLHISWSFYLEGWLPVRKKTY